MAFGFFDATQNQTPESIARTRDMVRALMSARGAPQNVGEGLNALGDGIVANVLGRRADAAEAAGMAAWDAEWSPIMESLMGGGAPAVSTPDFAAGLSTAPDPASARVAQAHGDSAIRDGIIQTAEALGIDPVDLATTISYETAGTFDPTKAGPTTQWGQHRGLIQFGEPQAQEHGVNWNDPVASQLGPNGAVASYLRKAGVQPGMGLLDIYSAVNAGAPGLYNRSDANNGGAPGTVRDKVEQQMAGHRQKALSLIGDYSPASAVAANEAMANGGMVEPTAFAPIETVATEPMVAPLLAEPRTVQDRPVASVAQSLFPMEEMAGMDPQFLGGASAPRPGVVQALAGQPQQQRAPSIAQLLQASQNPYAPAGAQRIIGSLIDQQMQANDPMRAIELERAQLELDALRNPQPQQTAEMQNLSWRAQQAGLQPGTPEYSDFILSGGKQADQTNITVNNGEGSKFYDKLDEGQATTFNGLSETGVQARSKMAQIDRLEGLLAQAQTGGFAMIKQAAGEYGINTEKLSDIQAAQALINELVPQQRQPGSGPMSDADLALFKQSLPRILNQPGGNQLIVNTMRGITQYQIQMGEIADAVADRRIEPAEAREQIRNLPNPLASITAQENQKRNRTSSGVEWSIEE